MIASASWETPDKEGFKMRFSSGFSAFAFAVLLGSNMAITQFPNPAFAAETPQAQTILTVTGEIGDNKPVSFDRAALEALGMESFETTTPWHNGKVKFEGVPMKKLLAAVHAKGDTVVAKALDDYFSEIPVTDFAKYHVLLALKVDGAYMPISTQGPLWIVYPYDSDPELQSEKYHGRSVWQINRIEVK
jgi:hypothetical protein